MNKKEKTKRKKYRIGIDARFYGLENRGLGRYTNKLLKYLDLQLQKKQCFKRVEGDFEFYIFLKKKYFSRLRFQSDRIHLVEADFKWYSLGEQLKWPFLIKKYNLDLMHFLHFNVPILYQYIKNKKNKTLVTLHDLILFHYPTFRNTTINKFFYLFKLLGYHLVIRIGLKKATRIITISNFTKKDLIKTLNIPPKKIDVIYEGAELRRGADKDVDKDILKKYGIIKPYLLYVGSAYPHKNLERLLLAFSEFNKKNQGKYQLVLVGKKDFFYNRIIDFLKRNGVANVVITGYLSEEKLDYFYRKSRLFVFPSLYEGFGLPPLEALLRGVPVASSSAGAIREILKDKVVYFNPKEKKSIADGIDKALAKSRGSEMNTERQNGEELLKEYDWRKMTRKVCQVYQKIIKEK